jgi:hypothetical protein
MICQWIKGRIFFFKKDLKKSVSLVIYYSDGNLIYVMGQKGGRWWSAYEDSEKNENCIYLKFSLLK